MNDEREPTPAEREQADKLLADYIKRQQEAEQAKEPNPLQASAVRFPPRRLRRRVSTRRTRGRCSVWCQRHTRPPFSSVCVLGAAPELE
jgi:hypothetical protein